MPLLLFHGLPGGCGFELGRTELVGAGAWMFTLERPGMGCRTASPAATCWTGPATSPRLQMPWSGSLRRGGILRWCALRTGLRSFAPGSRRGGRHGLRWDRGRARTGLDRLLRADLREEVQRYRAEPDRLIAEKLAQLQQRHAAWARDPQGSSTSGSDWLAMKLYSARFGSACSPRPLAGSPTSTNRSSVGRRGVSRSRLCRAGGLSAGRQTC